MFITSHVLLSLAVFGPRPEAIIGTILPDVFDYFNWVYHRRQGVISLDLLKNDPHQFDKNNDQGLLWEIDHACHSLFIFGLCLIAGAFGSVLFLSYGLHLVVDYFTHTRQPFSYLPFGKQTFLIGIYNLGSKNFKKMLIGDVLLAVLVFWRLFKS